MTAIYIIIALAVLSGLWLALTYNQLVRRRNMVEEGWSGIEVQLKRRSNLIPNLLESVKGYMGHEKGVLEKVTELRTQSMETDNPGQRGQVEGMLSGALGRLFAVAEGYPDLKASQNFLDLQQSLAELEEQIQLARRYYNGTVRDLNIKIESFPANLVAGSFGFKKAEFFELEDPGDRQVPKVSFS